MRALPGSFGEGYFLNHDVGSPFCIRLEPVLSKEDVCGGVLSFSDLRFPESTSMEPKVPGIGVLL